MSADGQSLRIYYSWNQYSTFYIDVPKSGLDI